MRTTPSLPSNPECDADPISPILPPQQGKKCLTVGL